MTTPEPSHLDYATPPPRTGAWPPLWLYILTLAAAFFAAATDLKLTPGGPFISIGHEMVPIALCIWIILRGCRAIANGATLRRVAVGIIMLFAATLACAGIATIVFYWLEPTSRGVLIGP